MLAGIRVSQVSPVVRASGRLMNSPLPCARACSTATATGESLRILVRTVKSRPSGGGAAATLCWIAGGSGARAVGREGFSCLAGCCFLAGGPAAAILPAIALAPTANALVEEPYVAGPFPSRSLASIQYSVPAPPGKLTRKTSSKSFFTIGVSSTLPPGLRW